MSDTLDADLKRVQEAVNLLGEHFETIQIFVTKDSDDNDGTVRINLGKGNWYARYGQVCYWLEMQKQEARNEASEDD